MVNKLKTDYWPRPSFCTNGLQTEAKPVTLDDVQGAYYVMAILCAVALVALLTEHLLTVVGPHLKPAIVALCKKRERLQMSGTFSDVTSDASPPFRYSHYFESFAKYETHEMRSVRRQREDHERKQQYDVIYPTLRAQDGGSMWTYDSERRNIFTYTNSGELQH